MLHLQKPVFFSSRQIINLMEKSLPWRDRFHRCGAACGRRRHHQWKGRTHDRGGSFLASQPAIPPNALSDTNHDLRELGGSERLIQGSSKRDVLLRYKRNMMKKQKEPSEIPNAEVSRMGWVGRPFVTSILSGRDRRYIF